MKYKLTKNEIYAIVNSIKPVPFSEGHQSIRFEFIEDSRFQGKTLEEMATEFEEKAKKEGLKYNLGVTRHYVWDDGTKQNRIGVEVIREPIK